MNDFELSLELPHPPPVLFPFLVDPSNRPLWQSSLRAVEGAGAPAVGSTWHDVTRYGVRAAMQITELEPFRLFTEVGTWRGIDAVLTMRFVQSGAGTRVSVEGRLNGRGPFAPIAALGSRWVPATLRADLIRASELLTERGDSD